MPPEENVRLALLEDAVRRLAESQHEISESLKQMVRLETCHVETREGLNRAFIEMEKMDERLREVEQALPELKTTSRWVKWGVIAVVATAMATVGKLVFVDIQAVPVTAHAKVLQP
jgi:hypothetical protein